MQYTLILRNKKNIVVSENTALQIKKAKSQGQIGWTDLGDWAGELQNVSEVMKGLTSEKREDEKENARSLEKDENLKYIEEENRKWNTKMTEEYNKPILEKQNKSVYLAEKLLDCVSDKLTDEMKGWILEDSKKYFESNKKVFYDQKWFFTYIKKHGKKMSPVQSTLATAIINTIHNANRSYPHI